MINVFQPSLGEQEAEAVLQVAEENWLGPGKQVQAFVASFADHIGVQPSELIAITSCTEGLFQILSAITFSPGDQVVMPTISFIGAAHAARSAGAEVVLCDVDPRTLNPCVEHIESRMTCRTKAIVLLHYGGDPGHIREIAAMARHKRVLLIEDAACAVGSSVDGQSVGTFGDIAAWSFDAMKILVTGDGGMIRLASPDLHHRVRLACYFGLAQSGIAKSTLSERWWEIEPLAVGRLALMNDLNASIGRVQLEPIANVSCTACFSGTGLRSSSW